MSAQIGFFIDRLVFSSASDYRLVAPSVAAESAHLEALHAVMFEWPKGCAVSEAALSRE
jgi:hypothetical protein